MDEGKATADLDKHRQQKEVKKALIKKAMEIGNRAPKLQKRFTLDGIVIVKPDGDGGFQELETTIDKDSHIPALTNAQEADMMFVVYTAITDLKINPKLKGRVIPLTRNELLEPQIRGGITDIGFTKGVLRSLEKKGLLEVETIALVNTKLKKHTGARTVVFFTKKGRDYVRTHINPDYRARFERLGTEQVVEGDQRT